MANIIKHLGRQVVVEHSWTSQLLGTFVGGASNLDNDRESLLGKN